MNKIRNTIIRNGWYHFQIKIPKTIQPAFPASTKLLRKALHTKTIDEAGNEADRLTRIAKQGFKHIAFTIEGMGSFTAETTQEAANLIAAISGTPLSTAKQPQKYLLSQAIQDYIKYKTPDWSIKSLGQNENILGMLLEIIGDKDVTEIKPADAELFRNTVRVLPANISMLRSEGFSLVQIAKVSREKGVKARSATTCNRQFTWVHSFMTWLADRDSIVKSYFGKLKSKKGIKPADERPIFTPAQLHAAFDNHKAECTFGGAVYDHQYWPSLIALYSGMRLNEIAQLHTTDIDVPNKCIKVSSEGGKSVKTLAGNRIVPVHSKLIELGFLDWASKITTKRLFHKLTKGADGYGHAVGRLFKARGERAGYPTFHSLRHTFIDKAKQAGIQEGVIAQLVGHAYGGITYSRYGKGYPLETLREAIEQVKFDIFENNKED